jgi:hypothetical protein
VISLASQFWKNIGASIGQTVITTVLSNSNTSEKVAQLASFMADLNDTKAWLKTKLAGSQADVDELKRRIDSLETKAKALL